MAKQSIYLERRGDGLFPADRVSQEKLHKVPAGRPILCRTHSPRNGKHHRLLWAVAQLVAENNEEWTTAEAVVEQLKYGTGHTEEARFKLPGGMWISQMKPKSIAYESMAQDEFSEWFERAMDFLFAEMMPGWNRADLEREVNEYLGVNDWPQKDQAA